jgi:hypothetical protein
MHEGKQHRSLSGNYRAAPSTKPLRPPAVAENFVRAGQAAYWHQIAVLERQLAGKRMRFAAADRALLAALLHRLPPAALRRMRYQQPDRTDGRWTARTFRQRLGGILNEYEGALMTSVQHQPSLPRTPDQDVALAGSRQ